MAKAKNYLGVDIGGGGIKVVNLIAEKNRPRLATYGFSERSPEEVDIDWFGNPKETASLLKEICRRAETLTPYAITSLPIASVFSAVINLPNLKPKEIDAAVRWEAKKLIPLPIEEVVLSWKILPRLSKEEEEKNLIVLLTGAPKSLVQKYVDVFKMAGLNLISLEPESFAFIRSLVGNDLSPVAIVDLGARKSNVLFVDRGVPLLARSIEIGGKHFSAEIAKTLNIPLVQAEELKKSLAELRSEERPELKIPDLLRKVLAPLLNEIKYSLTVFQTKNDFARPIEKIILTGGGALIPKIEDYFNEFFQIRTFLGDPWARLLFPEELKPILQTIGSRFSVAIGLALREF